jgi:hypothetical protein
MADISSIRIPTCFVNLAGIQDVLYGKVIGKVLST